MPREAKRRGPAAPKLALINLGCPKNLVDAERLLGVFAERGWLICGEPRDAELVLVNTCGFIDEARQESIGVLEEAAALKSAGRVRAVVGLGCLVERARDTLAARVPRVDAWVGLVDPAALETFCRQLLAAGGAPDAASLQRWDARRPDVARLRLTPRFYAYVRIAEGCDNRCNYCIIPLIRGAFRSKPVESVLEEVRELAADGAREINVIAQDTTLYGRDLYDRPALPELLQKIAAVPDVHWVRLLYTHPAHVADEVIELLAAHPKMCHYIDLPIQHINDELLRRMGRKVTRRQVERLIGTLRAAVPDIAIRTSLIVGFPGETQEQFEELLEFVRTTRFERLGAFAYSREEGTPAYDYPGHVSDDQKRRRLDAVMQLQQGISQALNRARLGMQLEVLLERQPKQNLWEGRTQYDAPEIDGRVYIKGRKLAAGRFCAVKVTGARGHYDLDAAVER